MENNELKHYGIKGQRWGFRRFQNKDGTLTAAGKKRYAEEMERLKKEEKIAKNVSGVAVSPDGKHRILSKLCEIFFCGPLIEQTKKS